MIRSRRWCRFPLVRQKVLFVTDLSYQARGRRYCDEDIFLTSELRESFDLALCHPRDATALMDAFDAVVVRNSGPVLHYQDAFKGFREQAALRGTRVYNPLHGRGDMAGKQYLLDLSAVGHPVIPPPSTGRKTCICSQKPRSTSSSRRSEPTP